MNKREFVCRAALAQLAGNAIYPNDDGWNQAWSRAKVFWDARPQWMKDDESRVGQFVATHAALPYGNPSAAAPGC